MSSKRDRWKVAIRIRHFQTKWDCDGFSNPNVCYVDPKPNSTFASVVANKLVRKYPFMKDIGSKVSGYVSCCIVYFSSLFHPWDHTLLNGLPCTCLITYVLLLYVSDIVELLLLFDFVLILLGFLGEEDYWKNNQRGQALRKHPVTSDAETSTPARKRSRRYVLCLAGIQLYSSV